MTDSVPALPEFLHYLERVRERTDRVVRCIPRDRIEWRPATGMFSFGDLLRHLAALERYMFAENVQGRPSTYPGHGPELADGYDATLALFTRLRDEAMAIYRTLTPAAFARRCRTPAGAELAMWKWLRAMVEHEIHHRAQLCTMLRLCGVTPPPLFGLTSEEVREKSRR